MGWGTECDTSRFGVTSPPTSVSYSGFSTRDERLERTVVEWSESLTMGGDGLKETLWAEATTGRSLGCCLESCEYRQQPRLPHPLRRAVFACLVCASRAIRATISTVEPFEFGGFSERPYRLVTTMLETPCSNLWSTLTDPSTLASTGDRGMWEISLLVR